MGNYRSSRCQALLDAGDPVMNHTDQVLVLGEFFHSKLSLELQTHVARCILDIRLDISPVDQPIFLCDGSQQMALPTT